MRFVLPFSDESEGQKSHIGAQMGVFENGVHHQITAWIGKTMIDQQIYVGLPSRIFSTVHALAAPGYSLIPGFHFPTRCQILDRAGPLECSPILSPIHTCLPYQQHERHVIAISLRLSRNCQFVGSLIHLSESSNQPPQSSGEARHQMVFLTCLIWVWAQTLRATVASQSTAQHVF